ncbi:hypothetical protein QWY75_11615 [Pontixanthobacter aestiaquae]|uniref:Uncharacterized protein n=1 Tax=Pontixanthobacter aestiaquae TaxID=1509367 RepID=A0A844Z8D4_9SPHN|nr:hypothetical protein [Pontixanthobacter aestiaquae]MDN3646849.1 hypothetical protein [Pontixanthobacter aestiaquae]MXO82169.1 hypothetical protein [Pontixanthobacter aestiaquae]
MLAQQATPAAAQPVSVEAAPEPRQPFAARVFVIEYPIYISPMVAQYTNCLRSREVVIGETVSFEVEHRKAVPLCVKQEKKLKEDAFERLTSRPKYAMTMEQLGDLFDSIKMTHIDRGRVMDGYMDRGLDRDPYAPQVGQSPATDVDMAGTAADTTTP